MARISQIRIAQAFEAGDAAETAHGKGQALENLLGYVFCKFPGVTLTDKNVLTADGSEEIDLVFWNDREFNGLPFLPNVLLFECKNWTAPVGGAAVVYFANKIRTRHLEFGFLIASNGVTGNQNDLSAAYQHLHNFLIADNVKIIVLTRPELLEVVDTKLLTALVKKKISRIILRGT